VAYDYYVPPTGSAGKEYATWFMKCDTCGVERKRTVGPRTTKQHGPLEPLAFLEVWRDLPHDPELAHNHLPVPQHLVSAKMRNLPNVTWYKDIMDRYGL
jgi:hypothetical protein